MSTYAKLGSISSATMRNEDLIPSFMECLDDLKEQLSLSLTEGRNGDYVITLYSTDIVILHPDGRYTLNSGGWQTKTTKNRINAFSPARLFQRKGKWYHRVGYWREGYDVSFQDGMTLDADTRFSQVKSLYLNDCENHSQEGMR